VLNASSVGVERDAQEVGWLLELECSHVLLVGLTMKQSVTVVALEFDSLFGGIRKFSVWDDGQVTDGRAVWEMGAESCCLKMGMDGMRMEREKRTMKD
jgi:hypothetical protein